MPSPSERLDEAAEYLGVELMPWQREIGEAILRGDKIAFVSGRHAGWNTLRRVVDRANDD